MLMIAERQWLKLRVMALCNRAEVGVGVVFDRWRWARLCGKGVVAGLILQRKAAPNGSRLRAVGRRCRRRGGGAGTVMLAVKVSGGSTG